MSDIGIVREFDAEQGFGVIDATVTPGGCFVHYSVVEREGYRALTAGDRVEFDHERGPQDGFAFRATRVHVVGDPPFTPGPPAGPGTAYGSTLTITRADGSTVEEDRPT